MVDFISRQLGIQNPEDIKFQWVHEIGKKRDCPHSYCALSAACLQRKNYEKYFETKEQDFTNYDKIPKELIDIREKHMPAFHQARMAGKRAVFSISEPDKLFIEGKPVS